MSTEQKPTSSRREMLGAMARWSVPTVVTLTLGARLLEAKASCPPCQRKQGQACKNCTISQMLNCNCEPCLGPPYCAAVGPTSRPDASIMNAPAPGSRQLTPGREEAVPGSLTPYQLQMRERARAARDPFKRDPFADPFGANRPLQTPGLYERLRDSTTRRSP